MLELSERSEQRSDIHAPWKISYNSRNPPQGNFFPSASSIFGGRLKVPPHTDDRHCSGLFGKCSGLFGIVREVFGIVRDCSALFGIVRKVEQSRTRPIITPEDKRLYKEMTKIHSTLKWNHIHTLAF